MFTVNILQYIGDNSEMAAILPHLNFAICVDLYVLKIQASQRSGKEVIKKTGSSHLVSLIPSFLILLITDGLVSFT